MELPNHIAIVMDGNGRWATKRMLPRLAGHRQGIESAKRAINFCNEAGVKILTLFAFSKENWSRPKTEINGLFSMIANVFKKDIDNFNKENIVLKVVGDVKELPEEIQIIIKDAEDLTKNNTGLLVNLALNYSGKWDITQAAQKVGRDVLSGNLDIKDVNEGKFSEYLHLQGKSEADLLIRTSGEKRISNFLLWHISYTELYFTDVFWPDFSKKDMQDAIEFFQSRKRRFGLVGNY